MNNPENTVTVTRELVERQETLVERVTDAHKALELSTKLYKQSWEEWKKVSETMLPECRSWRMAVDSELTKTLQSFGEVRKFFMSDVHVTEVQRLRELVDLCERLQALKENGFLDRLTDVILKLEIGYGDIPKTS